MEIRRLWETRLPLAGLLLLLLLLCVHRGWGCGVQTCPAAPDGFLNVHLIPHTHNDVGWLKTVDQYYYGGRNNIQHAGVQYILDSVVPQLLADPRRRFIYVESAFFWRWWKEQKETMQKDVAHLLQEGRLEFINGGWSMNDEAATHYNAIIDQMTLGLQFLQNTFGECGRPRVAWHIDPFGHSREQALLFAQMGFDGFFFGRLDYQDKDNREKTQQMEMIWRASDDLEVPSADLFTGVLPNMYNPPEGFCWDQLCSDTPIMDDPQMEDYNVDVVLTSFLKAVNTQASKYRSNHIVMTMGSDFQYENAILWFKNMDKLINLVNAQQSNGSKVNVIYSTPSCYLSALNKANLSWPVKMDDFFPYADGAHMFWTGYFTSRPGFKGYERLSNNFLQVCNQLEALTGAAATHGPYGTSSSLELRRAMGVAQHHDAVTGTAKQHVNDDYTLRLFKGWKACQVVVSNALSSLMGTKEDFVFCNLLNISVCPSTETSKSFNILIYNPLGRAVTQYIRLPVNGAAYEVKGPSGESIPSEVVPVSQFTKDVRRNKGTAERELVFMGQMPPLGFSRFTVEKVSAPERFFQTKVEKNPTSIENKFYRVEFDPDTGLISKIQNLEKAISLPVKQSYYWYNASSGNSDSSQTSGAYIFRPNQSEPLPISLNVRSYLVKNSLVQEVYQNFSAWCSQVVRLYSDQRYLELEWTVGPIPIGDNKGKEIISRFDTNLQTDGLFYTDANGRQILQRRKNSRDTWAFQQTEPVAGNYYPVNSRIFIKDKNIQLTVLTDRSQGGSSIGDGSVELMVHRRLLDDDYRGVGEALLEPGQYGEGLVVRGKHLLVLDTPEASADVHRKLALQQYMSPQMVFSTGLGVPYGKDQSISQFSALQTPLPDNLHLLTFAQHEPNKILLRLEHPFQGHESSNFSQPVTVNLKELFSALLLSDFKETTLAANLPKDKMKRMQWKAQKGSIPISNHSSSDLDPTSITLKPMEIRTFLATVQYRKYTEWDRR